MYSQYIVVGTIQRLKCLSITIKNMTQLLLCQKKAMTNELKIVIGDSITAAVLLSVILLYLL